MMRLTITNESIRGVPRSSIGKIVYQRNSLSVCVCVCLRIGRERWLPLSIFVITEELRIFFLERIIKDKKASAKIISIGIHDGREIKNNSDNPISILITPRNANMYVRSAIGIVHPG